MLIFLSFVFLWMLAGWFAYVYHRTCARSRWGYWTIAQREFWLPLCMIMGPMALFFALMFDTKEPWEDEQLRMYKERKRKQHESSW